MFERLLTALTVLAALSGPAHAQIIKPEAIRLAEIAMNDGWEAAVPALNIMFENLAQQARNTRGSSPVAPIFIEEIRRALSKENFTRAAAALYSEHMTQAELGEALAFITSATGRKFATLANPAQMSKFMLPMIKEACVKTRARAAANNLPADPQLDKACGG